MCEILSSTAYEFNVLTEFDYVTGSRMSQFVMSTWGGGGVYKKTDVFWCRRIVYFKQNDNMLIYHGKFVNVSGLLSSLRSS